MLIREILKNWMEREGHKILTAAIVLGVSESAVCDWIMCRSIPQNQNLDRLALALCASGLDLPFWKARVMLYDLALFDRRDICRKQLSM